MKCLYCDCTESKVIDSRSADDRTIRRRREVGTNFKLIIFHFVKLWLWCKNKKRVNTNSPFSAFIFFSDVTLRLSLIHILYSGACACSNVPDTMMWSSSPHSP